MTNLDGRLKRLEAHRPAREYCQCAQAFDYRAAIRDLDPAYTGTRDEDMTCGVCGRPKNIIPIVLTVFDYADGPHTLQTDASGRAVFDYAAAIAAIAPGGER